jgi:hypothetical protein
MCCFLDHQINYRTAAWNKSLPHILCIHLNDDGLLYQNPIAERTYAVWIKTGKRMVAFLYLP